MIEGLLDGLAGLDTHWFLLLAFFLPFGETVALLDAIVPGEVGMVLNQNPGAGTKVPFDTVVTIWVGADDGLAAAQGQVGRAPPSLPCRRAAG